MTKKDRSNEITCAKCGIKIEPFGASTQVRGKHVVYLCLPHAEELRKLLEILYDQYFAE